MPQSVLIPFLLLLLVHKGVGIKFTGYIAISFQEGR